MKITQQISIELIICHNVIWKDNDKIYLINLNSDRLINSF